MLDHQQLEQARPTQGRLTAEVVADIGQIYNAWEQLWSRDPYATPSTHPAWHHSYLTGYRRAEPIFLVLRDACGGLAGVCPLMRRGRRLCFLSTPRPDFI
ncbi:MAG: hypothetical protein JWQ97_2150, partial [Phenylobacterium sp.]|nr:hypothetical protein [Phenylobacterium sp.]